ncbi:MAG: phosphotransferase [Geminicoccaceae bacterium]|nr:phosphotransferase [Geminicoccaceae bacterium]
MRPRAAEIARFLDRAAWCGARRVPIVGDASTRRYERLFHPRHGRAVLVDSGAQAVEPWLFVRDRLAGSGIRVPAVLAADADARLLLLEDLGDLHLDEAIDGPERAHRLYARAGALLRALAGVPAEGLPRLDAPALLAQLELFLEQVAGDLPAAAKDEFRALWAELLPSACTGPVVFVHRDLHCRNLMVLADDELAVIDFQDAFAGPALYDLVSLVQDVRYDLEPAVARMVVEGFLASRPDLDRSQVAPAIAILGAQRALRILGVFARLAGPGGKPFYRRFFPAVLERLARNLAHPALASFARWWQLARLECKFSG